MSSTIDTAVREARQHIGGEWVDAAGGGTFDDLDPYTGDVVARVAAGGRADARRAIEAASAAFPAGPRRHRPSASGSSSRSPTCSRPGATTSSRGSPARPARASASASSRWGS